MKSRTLVVALVLVLSILITNACAPTQGKRINPVEQAGLRETVKIEVMQWDTWRAEGEPPYAHRLTITDAQVLDQLLDAMDTSFQSLAPIKIECIPEYELHFYLEDGTVQEFGYSCGGATFIRGEQDFWEGEDYDPPEQFDALIEAQLATTVPSEVNVVAQAGLTQTVKIEIFETVIQTVTPEAEGRPEVVEAQTFRRLTISDSETIGQIVAALDTVLLLGPRARVPMPYVLQFHLDDGTLKSLGYASGGENPAILRCDQLRCFDEQDAEPLAEFEALIEELLTAGTEGP